MLSKYLLLLSLISSSAFADFRAFYQKPQSQADYEIAVKMRDGHILDEIAKLLNVTINVPREVPLIGRSCGQPNAFYDPQAKAISVCYELMTANATKVAQKLRNRASTQDMGRIIAAELIFVVLHEVGHAVIDLYSLPVLGRQEDAADQFASYVLLSLDQEQLLKNALLFFEYSKPGIVTKIFNSKALYSDEHSLSEQRLANVVCWGFGKSPAEFSDVAMAFRVSQHRLQRCAGEYASMDRDIRTLLGNHLAQAGNRQSLARETSTATPIPAAYTPMNNQDAFNVLNAYRCLACHDLNTRKIGPSFTDIAQRYRGMNVEEQLVDKVKRGGSGVWGAVPAPPIPNASTYDLQEMVRWIVSR